MGPLRRSKISVEKLIEEVKRHPCLYDKNLEIYKDPNAKVKAWFAVGQALDQDPKLLKVDWKKLRDCYREALKREKKLQIEQPDKHIIQWKYRKEMEFVLPFMTSRETKLYSPEPPDDTQFETDSLLSKFEVEEEEVEYHLPEQVITEFDSTQTVVQYLTTMDQNQKNFSDPLDMFFASMCETTKRLPAPYQNTIKRELFQAVMQAEEQYQLEQASPLQNPSRSAMPWHPPSSSTDLEESATPSFTDGSIHVLEVVNVSEQN